MINMKGRCYSLSLLIALGAAIAFSAWNATAKDIEGLVFYLSFDEKDVPVDHSPEPAEIKSVKGNLKQVEGKIGKAAEFDGSSFIEVADSDKLDGMKDLTIEVWIKPDKTTDGAIASKRIANVNQDAYNLFLYTGSKMCGRINASADFWSKTVFEKGKWYHVAYVFEGKAKEQKMYVNGVLDAQGAQVNQAVPAYNSSLWIGELDATRGFVYKGVIDELGIWNIALSETQIKQAMAGEGKRTPVEPHGKLTTTWAEVKMR